MTPEASAYFRKRLEETGNRTTALADTIRAFPRDTMQALPPPVPGPRGGGVGGGGRFSPRPIQQPVAPRPAPAPTGAFQPATPGYTPPPPGYTPGSFANSPRIGPHSIRAGGSNSSPINWNVPLTAAGVPAALYAVNQGGEGLRERRDGPEEPQAPYSAYGEDSPRERLPYVQTRMPEEVIPATETVPYSAYGEDTPRERLGTNIPRLAASVTQGGEPSGSRTPSAEPSGSGVPSAAPAKGDWLSRLFSGPQYQGSGGQLLQRSGEGRTTLNWGDPDSAANYFRAEQAMRKLQNDKQDFEGRSGPDIEYVNRMAASQQNTKGVPEGKASGGTVDHKPTKEAMLHKALEIIHHMIQHK